jgi:hypothetical protein
MGQNIRRVEYFYTTVEDQPGEAYKLLSLLKDLGVSLLAMSLFPVGPLRTQLALFPEDSLKMKEEARKAKISLEGPHPALMVTGDDELGALIEVHERLAGASVNVVSANAVTDGKNSYGYVIYIRPEDIQRAASALDI